MIPFAIFLVYLAGLVYAFVRPVEIGNPPENDWFFEMMEGHGDAKETQQE